MTVKNFLQLPVHLRTSSNWVNLVEASDTESEASFIVALFTAMPTTAQTELNFNLFLSCKRHLPLFERILIDDNIQIVDSENMYYYLKKAIELGLPKQTH